MATSSNTEMKVGQYIINLASHIGSGAMDVIHPATDSTGRKVAAKRICGKDNRSMEKISKDLHKLTQLDHPNIVKFFYINQQTSTVWIFMEYCSHKDLNDFFQRRQLSKRQTFEIMIQIAHGVEYLHRQNIIHRDIKPSNILISCDNPITVKLTDFDFSKILEDKYGTSLMTTNVGTPAFKAPEFYLRNEQKQINYHRNVDIYALGLTYLAIIQENEGLVPQIGTPSNDSELYAPIGRIIAERMRYNKKPLDVIPDDKKNRPLSLWFSKLAKRVSRSSSTSSRDSAEIILYEPVQMKSLIRQMTHHVPEKRPSAAQIVKDLKELQLRIPHHVDLQLLSSHDTGILDWGNTGFTVMESGLVVLRGKVSEHAPVSFQMYQNTSAGLIKLPEVKGLCEHEIVYLLPVTVKAKELLAVSCAECQLIRLLNLETEEITVAFHNEFYLPGRMRKGEDVIFLMTTGIQALELDIAQIPFGGRNRMIQSGMERYFDMHYIPSPHKLLVFSDAHIGNTIRAVSAESGEKVWEVKGEIDGEICQPFGLLFSGQHQVLLVTDSTNRRLLVLHPRDGSHLQTIQLDKEILVVSELCLYQSKLIVLHHDGRKHKLSYFSIN